MEGDIDREGLSKRILTPIDQISQSLEANLQENDLSKRLNKKKTDLQDILDIIIGNKEISEEDGALNNYLEQRIANSKLYTLFAETVEDAVNNNKINMKIFEKELENNRKKIEDIYAEEQMLTYQKLQSMKKRKNSGDDGRHLPF